MNAFHLGDGVYVAEHYAGFVIFTWDGTKRNNEVFLGPDAADNFTNWLIEREIGITDAELLTGETD